MSKICTIFHECDLDGWMSAAIVKHWFVGNNNPREINGHISFENHVSIADCDTSIDFIGYNYGQPIPDLSEYDKVIMCDISFPKNHMESLQYKLGNNFIWIDHHISAINDCRVLLKDTNEEVILYNGMRDTKFAACELTWKYFFPNEPMPEIVRLLGRYDCFGHKGTNEEKKVLEFQYGARLVISNYDDAFAWLKDSINYQFVVNKNPYNLGSPEELIIQNGKPIYQYLCTEAKQVYKNGFCVEFLITDCYEGTPIPMGSHRVKFICINKERFNPINFGINYHEDGYDGCVCFYFDGKNYNFSLYNDNGEVDCSIIAKQYGGGGHFSAAGMVVDTPTMLKIIKQ